MSLLQIGSFRISAQGHRGVFYERLRHRTNLTSTVSGGACAAGEQCVDSYEDQYRIYIKGNGALSQAQGILRDLREEVCPEGGAKAYFRRRIVEDALLEIFRIRSAKFDETEFRLNLTACRTLAFDVTLELEPIPAAEETDVISGDLVYTP